MITPAEVEAELQRLMERLEEATVQMAAFGQEAGEAEVAHKVAFAQAFLRSDGPVATREQLAVVATAEPMLRRRIADAKLQAQRELLNTIRTQIDAVRTIAANIRSLV